MNEVLSPVAAAVLPLKEASIERSLAVLAERIAEVDKLASEAGFDFDEIAPPPLGRDSRAVYREKAAFVTFAHFLYRIKPPAKGWFGADEIRVCEVNKKGRAELIARTRNSAAADYDAFVAKLEAKLAEASPSPVVAASLAGDHVWGYSVLSATREDGSVDRWKTQTIINVSVYGKLFNQWPTRRLK